MILHIAQLNIIQPDLSYGVAGYIGPGVDDEPSSMVVGKFSNVYVTGKSLGPNLYDYAAVKYDSSGTLKWASPPRYNVLWTTADDKATAIALDSSGGGYSNRIQQ